MRLRIRSTLNRTCEPYIFSVVVLMRFVLRSSFRFRSVMRSGMEASAIEMTTFVEGSDDRESSNATTVSDANVNVVDGSGNGSDNASQKANGKAAKNGFHFR